MLALTQVWAQETQPESVIHRVTTSCEGDFWTTQIKESSFRDFFRKKLFFPIYTVYYVYYYDFNVQPIILTHCSKPSLSETCFKRALMKILKFKNAEMHQIISMQIQVQIQSFQNSIFL